MPGHITDCAMRSARYCFSEPAQDIVLLGSSIINTPSDLLGRTTPSKSDERSLDSILRCTCYENEVERKYKVKLKIACLGVPAAMISDQFVIVKSLISSGRAPKIIVIGYGPRDFIDNTICNRIDDTPVSRIFAATVSQNLRPTDVSIETLTRLFHHQIKFADLFRLQARRLLTDICCRNFRRAESLWCSVKKAQAVLPPKIDEAALSSNLKGKTLSFEQMCKICLAIYDRRYNPFDRAGYLFQMNCLEDTLRLCQNNKTTVVLVGMPLGRENLALLKPAVLEDLRNRIDRLSRTYGNSHFDMNNDARFSTYEPGDFQETVHLSRQGSLKFVHDLTNSFGFCKEFGQKIQIPN